MQPAKPIPDATASEPLPADACCAQGREALAAGDVRAALRHFQQALDADDEHADAHLGLAHALRASGRLEQAIGIALRLTVLQPQNPLAHAELAACFAQAGHTAQAQAAARRARVVEWRQQLAAEDTEK